MSTLNVDKVDPSSGTALELGTSGDTITVPSGATFVVAGTTEITGTNNVQRPPNAQSLIINGDMGIWQRGTETVPLVTRNLLWDRRMFKVHNSDRNNTKRNPRDHRDHKGSYTQG